MWWSSLFDKLTPLVPSALGAILGARYAQNQTWVERLVTWGLSAVMGVYVGGALGEYWHLGHLTVAGLQFGVAALGTEIFAYAVAAFRQGVTDPVGTARRWINAVLGRADV